MRANCPQCNTAYQVDDAKVPPGGARLKCAKCGTTFPIGGKAAAPAGAVPLPGTPGQAPVPLPGQAGPPPMPKAAGGAVPLPGSPGSAAVPLPGSPGGAAVPLPGQAGPPPMPKAAGGAVPLPGGMGGAAVPLPGGRAAPQGAAVPLPAPQNTAIGPDPFAQDFGGGDDFEAMVAAQAAESRTVSAPMPEAPPPRHDSPTQSAVDLGGGDDPFAMDFGEPPPPPAPAPAPAYAAPAADPGAEADPFAMDFGDPPPAPAPAPAHAAPAPAGDPGADNDPFAMDFGDGVPQAAPAAAPAPSRAAPPPADDNLEFDPTAPAAKPADDLEADLSAPIAPAGPAPQTEGGDDLELLDFIDDAEAQAKSKSKGNKRGKKFDGYQVRNRAGKIFGPMPENDVVKMLGEGKILGNEEISRDGENWLPFGSHGPFAEALQKLMEAPGGLPGASGADGLNLEGGGQVDVNERIKQIYGGRMAGIVIVDSAESIKKIKKRLPLIIAAAFAALGVAFGIYLGFTPYGFFGFRRLFPKSIKEGSAEFKMLVDGRSELAQGNHGSLRAAQGHADQVLRENDQFLQARALYAQATFALKDQYGEASPDALARAHKYVEEMKVTQPNDPDVVSSEAAELLLIGDAAELRPQLDKALKELEKKRPQGASEVALLLARSYAKAKDDARVRGYFDQADNLGESHVRALTAHATYLFNTLHDPPAAAKHLEKAAKEAPANGPAVLALAALRVGPLADPDHVEELLKPLDAKKDQLSTEEQGRMHALLGMVRVYQKKLPEAEAEFKKATELAPKSPAVEGAYASYLLKRGMTEQAEPLFQDAYNQHPDDLEFVDGLTVAMVGNGHQLNADKLVADAARRWPNNARVSLLQGIVSEGEDKLLDAEDKYKTAIKLDAKLTRADLRLARVYLRDGKLKEAHETLDAALKKAPTDPELNTAWGELAMAEGRVDDALGIFEGALKLDNDSAKTHLGRARALLAKQRLPDAEQECRTAITQDDRLVGTHKVLGDVLFAEGQFDKARDEYQFALKQDGKDADAYLMLGRSYFALNDFDAAQTAFENSRTLASTTYKPYFWLAQAHLKKHEITQAIESMNKALDNGGQGDAEVHYAFGLVYKAGDQHYNDALDEFKTALKLKPDYTDALESIGDAVNDANDYKGAQGYYEQAYATDAKRTALLGKIAQMLFKQAQYAKAIEAFKRHLQADPASVSDHALIGNCYTEMGKHKEAIAAYSEAVKLDPKNAAAWEKLGYAFKETNRNREGCNAFKEYLKVSPQAEDKKDIELELDSLCGANR